jgi:hypothetical protein
VASWLMPFFADFPAEEAAALVLRGARPALRLEAADQVHDEGGPDLALQAGFEEHRDAAGFQPALHVGQERRGVGLPAERAAPDHQIEARHLDRQPIRRGLEDQGGAVGGDLRQVRKRGGRGFGGVEPPHAVVMGQAPGPGPARCAEFQHLAEVLAAQKLAEDHVEVAVMPGARGLGREERLGDAAIDIGRRAGDGRHLSLGMGQRVHPALVGDRMAAAAAFQPFLRKPELVFGAGGAEKRRVPRSDCHVRVPFWP